MHTAMRFAAALAVTLAIAPAVCSPANHARNSPSWAGSNLYFLHALPADEQSRYIDTLADWGVKALRLWGKPVSTLDEHPVPP